MSGIQHKERHMRGRRRGTRLSMLGRWRIEADAWMRYLFIVPVPTLVEK